MSFGYGWRGPNIVKDGLVLYLDPGSPNSYYDKTSTTIKDISGNNYNGTLTNFGSQTIYNPANGGSISFDGTNDCIIHNSLNLGTVCSWGLWVKYNSLGGSPVLLGSNIPNYYSLFYSSGIFYVYYGTNLAQLSYPTGLSTNTWYNIFLTRDGLTVKVYLNGTFIGTMTGGSSTLATIFSVIGAERTNAYFFNGNITNISVYNRVLSDQEVLQNFNATKARFGL